MKSMWLKTIALGVVTPLLLVACSDHNMSKADQAQLNRTCKHNVYLQKYGCSLDRVEQAAQSGDPDAQYALGYLYYYGIGVPRDSRSASMWIQKAAKQGQPLAKRAVSLMASGSHLQGRRGGGGGTSIRQAHTNVNELNNAKPDKAVSSHLPNYRKGSSRKSSPVVDSKTTSQKGATKAERKFLSASADKFTLQLMGSHDLSAIKSFVRRHHLQGKVRTYKAKYQGSPWYMLVYGSYDSAMAARSASDKLPWSIRQLHPWVKPYSVVQREIRTRVVS